MGHHVIRQPNGKLALFSTIVDDFLVWDATKDELMAFEFEREQQQLAERMSEWEKDIVSVQETGKPVMVTQFSIGWDEAMDVIKSVHGAEHATEYKEAE